jgi:AbrB family looped-hinge helix DNA binding protein
MHTKVSTKGQVVLPGPLREQLGLKPGDPLDAKLEGGSIVLTPRHRRRHKARIVVDPRTGLAVLTAGPGARVLKNKQVKEILSEFP